MPTPCQQEPPITHYIALANEFFCFGDVPPVRNDYGSLVFACSDANFAESLIDLYKHQDQERAEPLAVIAVADLTPAQIVFANREIDRAYFIGANLDSDEYATTDKTFATIGYVAVRLSLLASELEAAIESTGSGEGGASRTAAATSSEHSGEPPAAQALESLASAVERHRLTFLFFATAHRVNCERTGPRHEMNEAVRVEEIPGYKRLSDDIDETGDFLVRHRGVLDRFADKALAKFGHGKGSKPDGEGSTYPHWLLDDLSAHYLQQSAEKLLESAQRLAAADRNGNSATLAAYAATLAYDEGQSRWYSSVLTRWEYLGRLDEAIARLSRARIEGVGLESEESNQKPPKDWCYLGIRWDEREYNHDPVTCGTWESDPEYLPVSEGSRYFFKSNSKAASRLLGLFEKSVKPQLESNGEQKVTIEFFSTPAEDLDADDKFLVEEQIEGFTNAVHSRHHAWRVEQGLQISDRIILGGGELLNQRPPLDDASLSGEFLFDRAERWQERLQNPAEEPHQTDHVGEASKGDGTIEIDGSHPFLPTLIVTTITLRDLTRTAHQFPEAIAADETNRLFAKLTGTLSSAAKAVGAEKVFESFPVPQLEDQGADMVFAGMLTIFIGHHKEFAFQEDSEESKKVFDNVLQASLKSCDAGIRGIVEQLHRVKLFDCIYPSSQAVAEFGEPRRAAHMAEKYWQLLRRLLMHHAEAYASYRPHPLRLMLTSMRKRFVAIWPVLGTNAPSRDAQENLDSFIETVLAGDPDELTVEPEWTYNRIGEIDDAIEQLRNGVGIGFYDSTPAESDFCEYAVAAITEYIESVDKAWKQMSGASAKRATQVNGTPNEQRSPDIGHPDSSSVSAKDLSETKKLILKTIMDLGAVEEGKKVSAPEVAEKLRVTADKDLRTNLANLRAMNLLGGNKGSRGYWLTDAGLACVRTLFPSVPEV